MFKGIIAAINAQTEQMKIRNDLLKRQNEILEEIVKLMTPEPPEPPDENKIVGIGATHNEPTPRS